MNVTFRNKLVPESRDLHKADQKSRISWAYGERFVTVKFKRTQVTHAARDSNRECVRHAKR